VRVGGTVRVGVGGPDGGGGGTGVAVGGFVGVTFGVGVGTVPRRGPGPSAAHAPLPLASMPSTTRTAIMKTSAPLVCAVALFGGTFIVNYPCMREKQ